MEAIYKTMVDEKNDPVISLIPVVEPHRYGIAKLPEDSKKSLQCVEKQKEPKSNLAMIGVHRLNPTSFRVYPKLKQSWRNEMEITDAISLLIDSERKVIPHRVEGWWKDTGRPEDILEANRLILDDIEAANEDRVEDGASVIGRVRIGKGSVIIGRSIVRGPLIVGEECKIDPNAYIGPYTAVGDRCHICFAEVDGSIVMDDTRLEVRCRLMRSMIRKGPRVLNAESLVPSGTRLIIGENTTLYL